MAHLAEAFAAQAESAGKYGMLNRGPLDRHSLGRATGQLVRFFFVHDGEQRIDGRDARCKRRWNSDGSLKRL